MVTLSDMVVGIGLAVVGGVILAGRLASGVDPSLPQEPVLVGVVVGVLLLVSLVVLSVHVR